MTNALDNNTAQRDPETKIKLLFLGRKGGWALRGRRLLRKAVIFNLGIPLGIHGTILKGTLLSQSKHRCLQKSLLHTAYHCEKTKIPLDQKKCV